MEKFDIKDVKGKEMRAEVDRVADKALNMFVNAERYKTFPKR